MFLFKIGSVSEILFGPDWTGSVPVHPCMYQRLQRRKERGTITITRSLLMNDACRMKLRSKHPLTKRLREIYDQVHSRRSTSSDGDNLYCQVCGATASKFCDCGAKCVPNSELVELKAFMGLVKSPRNPILRTLSHQSFKTMWIYTTRQTYEQT